MTVTLAQLPATASCIVFAEGKLLCWPQTEWQPIAWGQVQAAGWRVKQRVALQPGSDEYWVCEVARETVADGRWVSLRDLLLQLDADQFQPLGLAAQVLEWYRNHQYCGRCGQPNQLHTSERAMVCAHCGLTQYPRISPCVIVLVTRGREILLARSPRFTMPIYSCLAGFIEAGESAEAAVHREVLEEVNLRLANLRYWKSQPWPFPHQLMLGYFADCVGGDLRIDPQEILEACWFDIDNLPAISPEKSIAGQLIRAYVAEQNRQNGIS